MGISNREGALYYATGIDNSGLYKGKQKAIGIVRTMMREVSSFDVFAGIGISAAGAFAMAAKSAYNFEKQFQTSMLEVATISDEVSNNLAKYKDQIVAMTTDSGIPVYADESAKALYEIVSAGHDGAKGMQVLEASAKAAVGGLTETAVAADAITSLLNAYGKGAKEATQVSDLLFTTVKLGKTKFGELGKYIAQVTPIASSYGVEMEQVLAAVATLTASGTPTAQAMTQIRQAIVATSKYLGDGAFATQSFQEVLQGLVDKAGGSETALRKMIPEVEAITGILGLTGVKAQKAASDLQAMNDAVGATEKAFEKMQGSADNQMKLLTNNITASLRPLGTTVLKNVSDVASSVNEAFADGSMERALSTITELLKVGAIAWGSYKVAILANNVAKNISKTAVIEEAKALEQLLTTEQRALISKQQLTKGTMAYSLAVKEAAVANITTAKNRVGILGRELSALKKQTAGAKEQYAAAFKVVEVRKAELVAMRANGTAREIAIAEKRVDTATTNANTIATQRNALMKDFYSKKVAMSAARQKAATLATVENTAAQNASIKGTNLLKVGVAKLGEAFKKAMVFVVANPYLVAAAALAALGYGIYKYITAQTAAEKAQERYNKRQEEAIKLYEEHKRKIEELIDAVTNSALADRERVEAMETLKTEYPRIFEKYDVEKMKLADILNLKKEIAEEDGRRKVEDNKQNVVELEEQLAEKEKELRELMEHLRSNPKSIGIASGKEKKEEIETLKHEISLAKNTVNKDREIAFDLKISKMSKDELTEELEDWEKKFEEDKKKMNIGGISPLMGTDSSDKVQRIKEQIKLREQDEKNRRTESAILEDIERTTQNIASLEEKRRNKGLTTGEQTKLKELRRELLNYKAEIGTPLRKSEPNKGSSGLTFSKEDYDTDMSNQRLLAYNEKEQALIDAMEDGAEKERRQLLLNNKKALEDIDATKRRELQKIEEWEQKKREAQGSDYSPMEGIKNKKIVETTYTTIRDIQEKEGTKSVKDFDTKQKDSKKEDENKEYEKSLANYEAYVTAYIDKHEEFNQNLADLKNLGIDNSIIEQTRQVQDQMLAGLDEQMDIKKEAIVVMAEEMIGLALEDIITRLNEAQVALAEEEANKGESGSGGREKIAKLKVEIAGLKKMLKKTKEEKLKKTTDPNRWKKTVRVLGKINDAANDAIDGFEGMSDATKEVFKAVFTISASAITMITNISDLANWSMIATKMTAKGVSSTIQSVEKASVILAVIGAALQIATKIASLISGNKDKKKLAEIARMQGQVKMLKRAYDELGRSIEKAYATDAVELIDRQDENLRKQQELIKKQIEVEKSRKETDWNKISGWEDRIHEIDVQIEQSRDKRVEAIIGTDIKSAIDEFAEAYLNAWSTGEDKAKALKKVADEMVKDATLQLVKKKLSWTADLYARNLANYMKDGIIDSLEKENLDILVKWMHKKAEAVSRELGDYIKEDIEDGVSGKLQAAMTEGTASQLVGLWNMTAMDIRAVREWTEKNKINVMADLSAIFTQIAENTGKTAENTSEIADELEKMNDKLEDIKDNTEKSNSRG